MQSIEARADSWSPKDLRPAWRGEVRPPTATVLRRDDGVCILGPGINYLYGDSGDGKSFIALFAAAQSVAAQQHVVWVTYEEQTEFEIVERLKHLGVEERQLEHFAYVSASESLGAGIDSLVELTRQRQSALLVLDTVGEALAIEGIDEDRDLDFARWVRGGFRRLIDGATKCFDGQTTEPNRHLAVLAIDHSTKSREKSLFPSGTKRKRAVVTGIMLRLDVKSTLGRGTVGHVALMVAKDRSGQFPNKQIAAELVIDATAEPYDVKIIAPNAHVPGTLGRKRNAEDRIVKLLKGADSSMGSQEITTAINAKPHRWVGERELNARSISNALTKLKKAGRITAKSEPGMSADRYEIAV